MTTPVAENQTVTGAVRPEPPGSAASGRSLIPLVWLGTVACLLVFQFRRGFGWDGDSFVSAAQLVKLLNPSLYGTVDAGTHPKFLSILFFGLVYLGTGSFYLLSLAAITLHAGAVALVCHWIRAEGGAWFPAWLLLVANIEWNAIVINADNPGFSVPFLLMGLYFFVHRSRQNLGALLLLGSSLFRPGADLVLGVLLLREFLRGNRRLAPAGVCLALGLLHTWFGLYLAYPAREQFLQLCLYFIPGSQALVPYYKGSWHVLPPYFEAVRDGVSPLTAALLILPALLGLTEIIRRSSSVWCLALLPLVTLLYPLGSFMYGVITVHVDKVRETALLLPVFAAFCDFRAGAELLGRWGRAAGAAAGLALMAWLWVEGTKMNGQYQSNPDGSGLTHWRNLRGLAAAVHHAGIEGKFSVLTGQSDLTFLVLDNGFHLKDVSLLPAGPAGGYEGWDVVLLRREKAEPDPAILTRAGLMKVDFRPDYLLYVRRRPVIAPPGSSS